MDFQVVIDRKGAALFSTDTPVKYDLSDKLFFDKNCKERGIDDLFSLMLKVFAEPEMNRSVVHQKRVIHITVDAPTEVYVPDAVVDERSGI